MGCGWMWKVEENYLLFFLHYAELHALNFPHEGAARCDFQAENGAEYDADECMRMKVRSTALHSRQQLK